MKSALDAEGVLSEYDDISYLMYTDKEVQTVIMSGEIFDNSCIYNKRLHK